MQRLLHTDLIERALQEDGADLDLTTLAIISQEAEGVGRFIAKSGGVIAGLPLAAEVFAYLDPETIFRPLLSEGEHVSAGQILAEVRGRLRPLLSGERVALNFLQHLSGIATATAALVALIQGTGAKVLDTRKTTPGLRALEKYAVRMGGGDNHRFSLSSMILIKDNHIAAAGGLAAAVRLAKAGAPPYARLEVEAENEAQVREALAAGVDLIMLDNMPPDEMRRMVQLVAGRAALEASGNVTAETIAAIAAAGVNYISVGAITHSAPALDISLEIENE